MSVSIPLTRSAAPAAAAAPGFFDLDLLDNRYPALHGMRVLVIVSIVQYHVTLSFTFAHAIPFDPDWAATSLNLWFGMDLFFVLSGFIIGSILLRAAETGHSNVGRFYMRRAFRTFPAYYFTLTLLAVCFKMTADQHRHLWMEYVYLTNYGMPLIPGNLVMPWGWSLAIEEQFYLAVPLLLILLYKVRSDRGRIAILGTLWISALLVRVGLFLRHPGWNEVALYNNLYYRTHCRFDTLVAGIVIAYLHHRWRAPIARWLERPAARATLAIPALACLWLLLQPWMFGQRELLWMHIIGWGTLTSIMYVCWTLLVLASKGGWIVQALSLPTLRKVATLGYGVYLVHLPICEYVIAPLAKKLVERHAWPMTVVWPISVVTLFSLSLATSYALHLIVEKPALRVRDRVAA
ncbi:MAG: acyltransferase family protein [Polyangiaceae bacterium]